ncbi:hypothetical protein GCM10023338_23250 [Wohlfahrtiimonas larvae]|uniref:TraB/GumN family protein n=1 Tax=Wohlfahrtiimonas larvae TaxID=1157986 RepID=A0ABP9N087_9GAMM
MLGTFHVGRADAILPDEVKTILWKGDQHSYNFITVGNLHLFGKEGLIELLRKEGFELTLVLY